MNKQQQQIRIKPEQLKNIFCSNKECECPFFDKTHVLKKVPATVSPTGNAFIQPIELYLCRDCGSVVGEMVPPGAIVGEPAKIEKKEIN